MNIKLKYTYVTLVNIDYAYLDRDMCLYVFLCVCL